MHIIKKIFKSKYKEEDLDASISNELKNIERDYNRYLDSIIPEGKEEILIKWIVSELFKNRSIDGDGKLKLSFAMHMYRNKIDKNYIFIKQIKFTTPDLKNYFESLILKEICNRLLEININININMRGIYYSVEDETLDRITVEGILKKINDDKLSFSGDISYTPPEMTRKLF